MDVPEHITPVQASHMVERGEAIIVDVRELVEYHEMHIAGSVHIPLSEVPLSARILSGLKYDNVVMLCRIGRRSYRACQMVIEEGIAKKAYNIDGGINAWQEVGLPVVRLGVLENV